MSDAATLNITAPPSALPVCKIGSKEYTSFETALGEVGNNQTITLLADITHTPKVDVIGKTITFELNGKKLNIGSTGDRGLYVENGEVKLENAANGELNVNGHGVYTINGGKAEVHNIEMSASGGDSGAFAGARSEVTVRGNITVTTGNSTNNGAYASEGGKITVEGIITVPAGATYIMVGNSKKIQSGGVSNGGYLEYIDGTSIVKVKDTATAELKITGPAAMTLAVGYAATSSDIFTITGIPAPTVTKTSGDTKITWNNSTKKLDIAAGLVAGTYPVILKASAAGSPDVTHTFTLTVAEAANKAVSTGMQNFVKVETYSYGQFTDVNENAWYGYNQQKAVVSAFEYGLMKGNSNTIFNPMGDVRISEALAIAARVHSIYTTGTDSFVQGSPWYKVYVDYAIANGIIAANDFSAYDRAATRAEMAYIFSHALPKMEFGEQNTVNALPDVNAGTPYSESILTLYKAGVLTGSDDKGTFNPGNPISRAEAAAIISRVILPGTRA
ncbi:MAG: S-layer homology domain-containing protein, partial [Clostridiales bacterium]|nr:S-layer homology domain-containing protein [Clostridiales bacterium]